MRRHAGRQTDTPMHDLHTMAHVSNRDSPLDVFFNKLGMTETCRRLVEDPSLIAGIRIDALDSFETVQRPNPRNPLDFGASKDFPWLRSDLAPIDAPAQHLVPFLRDSEPAKLGHCRIPERILRGVSVA